MFCPSTPPFSGSAITIEAQSVLHLTGGMDLSRAAFTAAGEDLLVNVEGGDALCLKGYYRALTKPTLIDSLGFELTSEMIASMVRSAVHLGNFQNSRLFSPSDTAVFAEVILPRPDIRIHSGASLVLSYAELGLSSTEAATELLLLKQGDCGFLTADDLVLRAGDRFAAAMLEEGKVIYYHDESQSSSDTLVLQNAAIPDASPFTLTVHIEDAA